MKRNGKQLRTLPDGDKRRMSDGKNAWRNMTHAQRVEFLDWIAEFDDFRLAVIASRLQHSRKYCIKHNRPIDEHERFKALLAMDLAFDDARYSA